MLLILHFHALRVRGKRVGDVYTPNSTSDKSVVRKNYRISKVRGEGTNGLAGVEVSAIPTKRSSSGYCLFSHTAGGGDPLVRPGFKLFGQRLGGCTFLKLAAARMAQLIERDRSAAAPTACEMADPGNLPPDLSEPAPPSNRPDGPLGMTLKA